MTVNNRFFLAPLVSSLVLLGNGCVAALQQTPTSTSPLSTASPQQTVATSLPTTTTKSIGANKTNNSSIFHHISESEACELALKFNAFREKVDVALIRQSYTCATNNTDPNVPKLKGAWLMLLLPTPNHPQYQAYISQDDTYSGLFVPEYSVPNEASIISPLPPKDFYIESDNSFRLLTKDEYNEFYTLMNK